MFTNKKLVFTDNKHVMRHNLEKLTKNPETKKNSAGETSFLIVKDIKDLVSNERAKYNENLQFSLSFYNLEAMEHAINHETLGGSQIKGLSPVRFPFFSSKIFYQGFFSLEFQDKKNSEKSLLSQ